MYSYSKLLHLERFLHSNIQRGVSAQVASHNSLNLLPREKSRANSFRRLIFPRESLREVIVAYDLDGKSGRAKSLVG